MGSREYIVEMPGTPEIFVDGWGDQSNISGIFSIVGYRDLHGKKTAVVRLTMRTETAFDTAGAIRSAIGGRIGTSELLKVLS